MDYKLGLQFNQLCSNYNAITLHLILVIGKLYIYIYYEINYTILENLIYIYIYEKQTNILNFFENNFLYIYYIRFHFSMYFQRNSLEKYSHYIFRISLCDISEDY